MKNTKKGINGTRFENVIKYIYHFVNSMKTKILK